MGSVRMGPPQGLVLQLKREYGLRDFIETGTYYGATAVWAASHFERVITIEYSREVHQEVAAKYRSIRNVDFVFGDSRAVLKDIAPTLERPAILWLDSHWCGGKSYGEKDQCSLIEEIRAMNASKCSHFVLVDDARLFTSPPPRPSPIEQWPAIDQVVQALKSVDENYYIVIIEDVIIAVPKYARDLLARYCQDVNTRAWKNHVAGPDPVGIRHGCRLIVQGLALVGEGLRARFERFASRLRRGLVSR